MINQLTLLIINSAFLLYFSYLDLKYSEIPNKQLIKYLIVAVAILLINQNYIITIFTVFLMSIISLLMWKYKTIGGADAKILIINTIFLTSLLTSFILTYIGFLYFFMILAGLTLSELIIIKIFRIKTKNKKYMPFIPTIFLTMLFTQYLLISLV